MTSKAPEIVSHTAVRIVLTGAERKVLQARVARVRTEQRDVVRAKIVLAAADQVPNARIAASLKICQDTVRKWRGRFATGRLDGLKDLPRSGRPRVFGEAVEAEIKALACALPTERDVPLSRWSATELATEAIARNIVNSALQAPSASTISRWLHADAIKPWQCRSWIFPRDPDFGPKAGRVLDLFERRWNGRRIRDDEYVISADEKSQLQALRRRHPDLPAAPGRVRRQEFQYTRAGTLAYLAAYDVHHGNVIGTVAPTTGIVPFAALVEKVMTSEPYASARRVFWVVDNGSSHSGAVSVQRMHNAWPTAQLVHLPIHASWLNPVEIFFSIVQRKIVKPQNFPNLEVLAQRLLAFQDRYNLSAEAFRWRYTRKHLNQLLDKLATHEAQAA
jgi:transposase